MGMVTYTVIQGRYQGDSLMAALLKEEEYDADGEPRYVPEPVAGIGVRAKAVGRVDGDKIRLRILCDNTKNLTTPPASTHTLVRNEYMLWVRSKGSVGTLLYTKDDEGTIEGPHTVVLQNIQVDLRAPNVAYLTLSFIKVSTVGCS